jgi:phospholipid-binding lipoprotein MlaA
MNFSKKCALGLCGLLLSGLVSADIDTAQYDPFERVNRGIYRFNKQFDRFIFKPLAKGYQFILPNAAQTGISNFFGNLKELSNTSNNILQANFPEACISGTRFVVNSTIGLLGFADPATLMDLPHKRQDFGLTLTKWGYKESSYLMLPILGPSTVRDTIGLGTDYYMSIYPYLESDKTRHVLLAVDAISKRADLLDKEKAIDAASVDEYIFIRDAYLQRRNSQQSGDQGIGDLDNYPN